MIRNTEQKVNTPEGRWCWYNLVGANSCSGVAGGAAVMYVFKVKVKAALMRWSENEVRIWLDCEQALFCSKTHKTSVSLRKQQSFFAPGPSGGGRLFLQARSV